MARRVFLASCFFVSLVPAACGPSAGAPPDGSPTADAISTSCMAGESRCIGNTWEQCQNGMFQPTETCTAMQQCDFSQGCVALPDVCQVSGDIDGVPDCTERAPADSFQPDVQWVWMGANGETVSPVIPLVANFTDDNNDGSIDLCDIPDVVVVAGARMGITVPAHIYLLDGETGTVHMRFPTVVSLYATPALGDIDNDGLPEIVTKTSAGNIIAFEHDGTLKWQSTVTVPDRFGDSDAVALADLDNDGDVEIVVAYKIFDHLGQLVTTLPMAEAGRVSATAIADLDGDGDLEVVLGKSAYHHDGSVYFVNAAAGPGFASIANLDSDPQPEILLTSGLGISVLEHDGTTKYLNLRPTGTAGSGLNWIRPTTVHDFDGDNVAEFAVSSAAQYAVYEADASIVWQAVVVDQSGAAAGTAFDFLGDGIAEAMYADERNFFIYDGATGAQLLSQTRASLTIIEYPVVADIDNDGSAEILIVSNTSGGGNGVPTVQAIRDVQDRWIQARRIWNQHTYHVTNVREDSTIPQFEKPSWETLNTYRTNAQIQNGGVCEPIVE